MRSSFLRIIALLLASGAGLMISSSLHAEEITLYCKNSNRYGLYEQCQEVIVMEAQSNILRVYSRPQRIVMSVKVQNLFSASSLRLRSRVPAEKEIALPGHLLSNSSKLGFLSLCRSQKPSGAAQNLVHFTCGSSTVQSVQKDLAYTIRPYRPGKANDPRS